MENRARLYDLQNNKMLKIQSSNNISIFVNKNCYNVLIIAYSFKKMKFKILKYAYNLKIWEEKSASHLLFY